MSGKQHKRQRQQQRTQEGTSGRDAGQEAYQARISHVMGGQLAPAAARGGVRALLRCPACGRAWLLDSAEPHGSRLMLTDQEIQDLARDLHAELGQLPYAVCRACSALHGIGEVQIDQYTDGMGYGISWEGADPPGAHMLCAVLQVAGARALEAQGRSPRAGVVTDFPRCRAWLRWVATLEPPSRHHILTAADAADMAAMNAPGHGSPGTEHWRWQGMGWVGECPPLDGQCVCTFSQAMPPGEPFSPQLMFRTWRRLAAIILEGTITGEENADPPDLDTTSG